MKMREKRVYLYSRGRPSKQLFFGPFLMNREEAGLALGARGSGVQELG